MTGNKMDSFVYKWTNMTLNKIYIGFHKGTETDGYICSSASEIFWKDFRNESFLWKREILFKGTMAQCQALESQLLDSIDITCESVYNNKNNLMFNLTDEVRKKLSVSAHKRGQDPIYREQQANRTRQHWENNPERRKKQSELAKNKPMTEETKDKIKKARVTQIITPESRQKAAEKIRGMKYPKSHGEKISLARRNAPQVICPHCGLIKKKSGSMSRHHFENCKMKKE